MYSAASDRMMIFGGDTLGCSKKRLNDVWVLKNASGSGGVPSWEQLTPAGTAPPARAEHVAFYDQANNRMMIFGGDGLPGGNFHDLWVLINADGTGGEPEWENLTEGGTTPSATGYAGATYDPITNRLTVFGGWVCCKNTVSNQTWVLINANGLGGNPQWIRGKPTGTLPTARAGAQARYHPTQNSAVYFGGSGTNDVWQLSNANGNGQASWTKMGPQGTPPAGRGGISTNPASVYDSANDRFIIFGGKGTAGIFNDVWVLAPGSGTSSGTIYVLDTDNHRVQSFDSNGNYQNQFGHSFDLPVGIALDSSNNVYVKDGNHNCSADKFDSKGNFLLQFGICSPGGIGPGIFDNTGMVASDAAGNVWVTSPDFYYMQKFDSNGHFLAIVCMANVLSGCPPATPFSVQPQAIALDPSGNIYVTNVYPFSGGNNVVKFSSTGVYLSSFGSAGSGNGQFKIPEGIVFDSSGNIYIADSGNNRIQKFDSNGVYQSQFGSAGSGNGQFSAPVGLAFDSKSNLYVTDVGNDRVQKFDSSGIYQSQFGIYGSGTGQFFAPYGIAIIK